MGNVGQLGIDLLILHTAATRCAIIESPDVLPVAGRGAFADQLSAGVTRTTQKDGLVTSLEVFKAEKDGVSCFFLQQRGPVATGRSDFPCSIAMVGLPACETPNPRVACHKPRKPLRFVSVELSGCGLTCDAWLW